MSKPGSLRRYFANTFRIVEHQTPPFSVTRPFVKWYFDALKNFMIVAAISIIADKSHIVFMRIIAFISTCILSVYFVSYLYDIYITPFPSHVRLSRGLNRLAYAIVVAALFYVLTNIFNLILEGLVQAQWR